MTDLLAGNDLLALLHLWVHCVFVQLQPAVTTGLVSSKEQASCNKSGMCLFDGVLEMRVQLGGKQICQWREWIIAIAVQCWHTFQSPIHLSAVCVCSFGGKAKPVTSSEHGYEPVGEVFPWRWVRAKYKCRITCLFPQRFGLCVSRWQVEPHCAGFNVVWIHNNIYLLVGFQHIRSETKYSQLGF